MRSYGRARFFQMKSCASNSWTRSCGDSNAAGGPSTNRSMSYSVREPGQELAAVPGDAGSDGRKRTEPRESWHAVSEQYHLRRDRIPPLARPLLFTFRPLLTRLRLVRGEVPHFCTDPPPVIAAAEILIKPDVQDDEQVRVTSARP